MSDEDEAQYEELYFSDTAALDALEVSRDELIEEYLHGQLPATDVELFRRNFLAFSFHREQLEVTRALIQAAAAANPVVDNIADDPLPPTPLRSRFNLPASLTGLRLDHRRLFAAAAILIVLITGFLFLRGFFGREEPPRSPETLAQTDDNAGATNNNQPISGPARQNPDRGNRNDAPLPERKLNRPPDEAAKRMAIFLLTSATKSADRDTPLVISSEARTVRLQVALAADDYLSYAASIKTLDGETTFLQSGMKPTRLQSGSLLSSDVPARRFGNRSYSLSLEGRLANKRTEEIEKYYFRIRMVPPNR